MVNVRSAKSKGSQFEQDVEYNLKKRFKHIRRLGGEGQYREIDLIDDESQVAVECKRHKGFSWLELQKYFFKLEDRAPDGYKCYLIFKANRQPPLVMEKEFDDVINMSGGAIGLVGGDASTPTYHTKYIRVVKEFQDVFNEQFEKHKTVKRR